MQKGGQTKALIAQRSMRCEPTQAKGKSQGEHLKKGYWGGEKNTGNRKQTKRGKNNKTGIARMSRGVRKKKREPSDRRRGKNVRRARARQNKNQKVAGLAKKKRKNNCPGKN